MVDTLWEENPHVLVSLPGSLMMLSIREWDRFSANCASNADGGAVYDTPSGSQVFIRHDLVEFAHRVDEAELVAREVQQGIRAERQVPE
jgi:hypothetical protein